MKVRNGNNNWIGSMKLLNYEGTFEIITYDKV